MKDDATSVRNGLSNWSVEDVGLRHGGEFAVVHVVDRSPHNRVVGQHFAGVDSSDVFADALLNVGEGQEIDVRAMSSLGLDPVADFLIGRTVETATRVVDDDVLSCAEPMGRHDHGADCIVGRSPTGVTQNMGIADRQPEEAKQVEAGIHTREDHEASGRSRGESIGDEGLVVCLGRCFDSCLLHVKKNTRKILLVSNPFGSAELRALGQQREQIADAAMILDRVTQRKVTVEAVVIVTALSFTGDVPVVFEVGDDVRRCPLRDSDSLSDIAYPRVGSFRDANQYVCMI